MKDLIMISSYCDTKEKEDVLRNLVSQINKEKDTFDLMIVSHSVIPDDISSKCDFVFFDKKNELLYDWGSRSKPWFNPSDDRAILSVFTGFFNTHLAIWRMIIIGNSIAKNCGYKKVHHLEYDCSIKNFSEFYENSKFLDNYDAVTYNKTIKTVDPILFGTFQSYRLDKLPKGLLELDEKKIKNEIKNSSDKSPEKMLFDLLNHNKNVLVKNKEVLDKDENEFGMSHNKISNGNTAWCVPYYDSLTHKLGFVVWNSEQNSKEIDVKIIYNDEQVINLETILPNHWKLIDIDDYSNAKKLTTILNGKIRNDFNFDLYREEFKINSFRQNFRR